MDIKSNRDRKNLIMEKGRLKMSDRKKVRREIKVIQEETPPRFQQFETPDSSVADAIKKMTSRDAQAVLVLANVEHNDIARLSLWNTVGESFDLQCIKDYLHSELSLTAALKGKRADQLTDIARSPPIVSEGGGIIDRLKSRLH
jgi:hypothetical protein